MYDVESNHCSEVVCILVRGLCKLKSGRRILRYHDSACDVRVTPLGQSNCNSVQNWSPRLSTTASSERTIMHRENASARYLYFIHFIQQATVRKMSIYDRI